MSPVCLWLKFYYFKVKTDKIFEEFDLKQSCDWLQLTTQGHILKKLL